MNELELRRAALEAAAQRRKWRLEELTRRMKEEFGCDAVEELIRLRDEAQAKAQALEQEYLRMYHEVIEKYPQLRP